MRPLRPASAGGVPKPLTADLPIAYSLCTRRAMEVNGCLLE
jgi:hypothetical protein